MTLRKFLTIAGFAALLPLIAACGTMEGFGEDVEATGEALQDESD